MTINPSRCHIPTLLPSGTLTAVKRVINDFAYPRLLGVLLMLSKMLRLETDLHRRKPGLNECFDSIDSVLLSPEESD